MGGKGPLTAGCATRHLHANPSVPGRNQQLLPNLRLQQKTILYYTVMKRAEPCTSHLPHMHVTQDFAGYNEFSTARAARGAGDCRQRQRSNGGRCGAPSPGGRRIGHGFGLGATATSPAQEHCLLQPCVLRSDHTEKEINKALLKKCRLPLIKSNGCKLKRNQLKNKNHPRR